MTATRIALTFVLVALALPFAASPVAAADDPVRCWTGIDGSTTCQARTVGCTSRVTVSPDGDVDGWLLAC